MRVCVVIFSWFQHHDSYPAHVTPSSRKEANEIYSTIWIGRGEPLLEDVFLKAINDGYPALPRENQMRCRGESDLTSLDFFLWGTLNDMVYATQSNSPENFRNAILRACPTISPEIIENAWDYTSECV